MDNPLKNRRLLLNSVTRLLNEPTDAAGRRSGDDPPRLTPTVLESTRMPRSRERILANLDEMYREAFARAQASGDQGQMATLDFAYRREQLYFEILLDVRDAVERR